MTYQDGNKDQFIIYSKSGCKNCTKIKFFFKNNNINFLEVNCDDYILDDRDDFLNFIYNKIGKTLENPLFPFVFFNKHYFASMINIENFCNNELIFELMDA